MTSRWLTLATLMLAVATLGLGVADSAPARAQGMATLRVAHMAPGAPPVTASFNGQPAFTNVAYKAVTSYVPVPAGRITAAVVGADAGPALFEAILDVPAGRQSTVIATGAPPSVAPLVITDDSAAPAAG